MACIGTTLQIPECNENTDLDTGMYQVQDSLHHHKYILNFHDKCIKKSAADRQSDDRSVPGDTAECCSVSEITI